MAAMIHLSARAERTLSRWVFSCFLVFGSVLAFSGAVWLWSRVDYVRNGSLVDATVIKLEAKPSGANGPPPYVPTFRFSDGAGKIREVESGSNLAGGEVRVGDRVGVIYNASNEKGLLINRFNIIYEPPLFVTGFGALFALFSFVGLRRACSV